MIAVTSIAPGHKNFESQFNAVKSWKEAGYKVLSLNSKEEITKLKDFKGVEFIETTRTNERIFGKPYVLVSAIIDHLKTLPDEHFLIINSDIIIEDPFKIENTLKKTSESGVIIMNRSDFETKTSDGKRYEHGFDGFFINKKWLNIYPQSILCLGQCFWDFWVPYQTILANVPLYRLTEPYLFHKKHEVQYSTENWITTGEIFRGEVSSLDRTVAKFRDVPNIANYVYQKIKKHGKYDY